MKSAAPIFADASLNILVDYLDSKFEHVNVRFDRIEKTLDSHTKLLREHTALHESHERKLNAITEVLGETIVNVRTLELKQENLV